MDNNWIVENLTNAFGVWTSKMTEMWSLLTESPQTFKGGTIWQTIVTLKFLLPHTKMMVSPCSFLRANKPIKTHQQRLLFLLAQFCAMVDIPQEMFRPG